jgi:Na+/H+ antiporter NhaD/arsenite permease-like protein
LPALSWLAALIIVVTLVGVVIGRYPWLRMNRATIAWVGATLLILIGAISLNQAYAALDLDILTILFSMMVINANLRIAGFFQLVARQVVCRASSPLLSALFLNDTIVLMFTPLVLEVSLALKRNPLPYLMGLVTSANIGSVATITGNPQNMLIGIASQIPYLAFMGYLVPVAVVGLGLAWAVIVLVYRKEFSSAPFQENPRISAHIYRPLLYKSLLATVLMLAAFVAGVSLPLAALAAAAALLVSPRVKSSRVLDGIDWSFLMFFSGLFIVTGAVETSGLIQHLLHGLEPLAKHGVASLTGTAVVLSNLVSNVPAVLLFRPLIPNLPHPHTAWLTLAMATTLAGNLTLLGSVANLIAAESASRRDIHLGFLEYLKTGVPITLLSLVGGILWLSVV